MFKTNTDTLDLTGKSGKSYSFQICEYDTLEAIDNACEKFTTAGLYVFAYRYAKQGDSHNWYVLKYIGETKNFSERDYSNHHKKKEIVKENCNAWGYLVTTCSEKERLEMESDLIDNYNPLCNG
ncbi:MAG: hypothetical protein IJS91_07550 [Bacteroidales bacterium]|nr:hypothetical protein [Bacteroidales bacterium]